jgi:hypothetical protein
MKKGPPVATLADETDGFVAVRVPEDVASQDAAVRRDGVMATGESNRLTVTEEDNPNNSVTLTDSRCVALALRVGSGQTFVDVGGGRGGPGLWVARGHRVFQLRHSTRHPLLEAARFALTAYEATPRGEQLERGLYQSWRRARARRRLPVGL